MSLLSLIASLVTPAPAAPCGDACPLPEAAAASAQQLADHGVALSHDVLPERAEVATFALG